MRQSDAGRARPGKWPPAIAPPSPAPTRRSRGCSICTRDRFLGYRDRCPTDSCIATTYRGRMREIDDIMAGRWRGRNSPRSHKLGISRARALANRAAPAHSDRMTGLTSRCASFPASPCSKARSSPRRSPSRPRSSAFPAVALTDRNGLYAAMPFGDACFGEGRAADHRRDARRSRGRPISARPARSTGWCCWRRTRRATTISAAWSRSAHLDRPINEEPHVAFDALDGQTDGLIALTAGGEGALARLFADGQDDKADAYADRLKALFPDRLYVELSRRGDAVEEAAEAAADRPGLCARPAAGRDQPRPICRARFPRRARRHAVHRRFDLCRNRRPQDQLARSLAQARRRHGGAVRRPARGDRQHRRRRPALRRRRAQAPADPAAPQRRRGRDAAPRGPCRARRAARRSRAEEEKRQPIASGSISRSTSSPAWASPATS